MSNSPSNAIPYLVDMVLDPAAATNLALQKIDALLQLAVINMQATPPGSPADGDRYIVTATATGSWAGEEDQLARWVDVDSNWEFYAARIAYNLADGVLYVNDSGWGELSSSATAGITAFATGGQGSAVVLNSGINEISTCATAGDSVKLKPAVVGLVQRIINNGAAACDVFPDTGDDIGAGTNTAISLGVGAGITYACFSGTEWHFV